MHRVSLPRLGTFEAWRQAARRLASAQVAPENVDWGMAGEDVSLFQAAQTALPADGAVTVNVPRDFPPLARLLSASRTPGVFDLCYRLLTRVAAHPGLMHNRADADMGRAQALAKNIRRDMHKMKAFVRFREVTPDGADRRQFISWFEPDHRIEELIAGFFTRRFGDMDWVIVTPDVTTRFENGALSHEAVESARLDLTDETEALWKTYYANIFNPARLKIKAMQSEMPKKYWKNLPEAALIPDLIAQAEARVMAMRETAPSLPPVRAQKVLARQDTATGSDPVSFWAELKSCARCPLAGPATQAVSGAGPQDAPLMIVGEQPGDHEDLEGRPFVGPAGQLLDAMAAEAGLDRAAAYVTNAVKHFKFQVRGKRRIHQSPNRSEVDHCRGWLDREVAQVQPAIILALGATAALALTGNGKDLMKRRGRMTRGLHGVPVFITLHPAAVLRQPDAALQANQRRQVVDDLRTLALALAALPLTAQAQDDPQGSATFVGRAAAGQV